MRLEEMSREELIKELRVLQHQVEKLPRHEHTTSETTRIRDHHDREKDALVHDLEVHQVELELQNRELREAHSALEATRHRFEELYDFAPVAYYTLDLHGCVQEVNLTGATMVGRDRARLIGMPFLSLVKMQDSSTFWEHLRRCTKERQPVVSEWQFSSSSGMRDVQVVSAPVIDATGKLVAFRTSFADITQRKHAEVELERARRDEARSRQRFEALDRATFAVQQALASESSASRDAFLQVVVDQARLVANAEFAALGIGVDPTRPFDRWVFSGMDPAIVRIIGQHPRPVGLLGEVIRSGASIRLRDLREHPAFSGFPPHHPAMSSFLGVSISVRGAAVGHLYLTNARSGDEFTSETQRTVEMLAERAGLGIEIARLSDEVRAAANARTNLLAVVSHDLRSPLSAIQLSASVLAQPPQGGERRQNQKQLAVILRATARMKRLIDDLLQAATIEAGTFTVEADLEQVRPIVDEAIETVEPLASPRSVRLLAEVAEATPPIQCDRGRLIQVLVNLAGNAVKFAAERGTIRVQARPEHGDVHFSVSDDGPGIAADQLEHVFDRYWKGVATGRHGAGLGLYIAKGIIDAHRGKIWVESQLGAGATFHFTIPIADGKRSKSPGPKLVRVMVIDDDPDCLEVVSDALALSGYGVITASNGREALRALECDPKPALILLDLMMPVMDGWQFLEERNRRASLTQIPVALLSGERDLDKRARSLGVAGSIPKPAELDQLLSVVERLVGPAR